MSTCYSTGERESIKQIVREVLKEESLLGIHSHLKEPEDQDILKIGMILEGTCKCDESKKDYFVILKGTRCSPLNIKCLTRTTLGWSNPSNESEKGRTAIDSSSISQFASELSQGFEEYNYRIIPGLTLDTFREVIQNESKSK